MSPVRMSKVEEAMRLALAFQQAFNRHDVAAIQGLLSDGCRLESNSPTPDGAIYNGKTAIAQYWQEFYRQLPQARLTVEEIFGYGQRCMMRWRCDWTDRAGETRHLRGLDIFEVNNGLIVAQLSYAKTMLVATEK